MDVYGISTHTDAKNDGVLPCVAQYVLILLVDHDTTSLMSFASQFEQQLYKDNDLIYLYISTYFRNTSLSVTLRF